MPPSIQLNTCKEDHSYLETIHFSHGNGVIVEIDISLALMKKMKALKNGWIHI